mgnify:CR=1 FL=1
MVDEKLSKRERTREKLKNILPEIRELQDESLRKMVEQVWISAATASVFEIDEAPNFPSRGYPAPGHSHPEMTRYGLMVHTRMVIGLVKDIAKRLKEMYGMDLKFQELLAAALIHDADKMVYFTKEGGEVVISEESGKIPHGFYATKWALDAGAPLDVAHAVIAHTGRAAIFPKTLEGLILEYADLIAADVLRKISGAKGILETYKQFGPASATHM